jgi:hypothetical protein
VKNPIDTLISIVQSTSLKPEDLQRGCPLSNLSQEMSPSMRDSASGRRLSFPAPAPTGGDHVDELTKHRRRGTERELFAFL